MLSAYQDTRVANPFLEIGEWQANVKAKYAAMKKLAKADPKRALDTQYDKRKVR
jgi:hypothetical protein